MTTTSDCKPWCTDHKTIGEDSCYTRVTIYDSGNNELQPAPAPGSMAALFEFPKDIAWMNFVASQDENDEQPVMDLFFFEAGKDEPITTLALDQNTLKQLHRNLGTLLSTLA